MSKADTLSETDETNCFGIPNNLSFEICVAKINVQNRGTVYPPINFKQK